MTKAKLLISAGLAGASALASLPAAAEVTGNVAATSEYIFRGISSSGGAAVQGGMDYAGDSGVYSGFWISNTAPFAADENELDLYVGFAPQLTDNVALDFGALYYVFSEDEQSASNSDFDYLELYTGVSAHGFSLYAWYAYDFFGVDDRNVSSDSKSIYFELNYDAPLTDKLSIGFHIGTQVGDGADALFGIQQPDGSFDDGEYVDYGISLNSDLGNGWGASFGVAATDLDNGAGGFADEDEPKFYVTLSKDFSIIE